MSNYKYEIIVSTMNSKLDNVISRFSRYSDENCLVTIVHQVNDGGDYIFKSDCKHVRYLKCPGIGLPNSRNYGAEFSCGQYLVFTDDDVEFRDGFKLLISSSFEKFGSAGILTFKTYCPDVGKPYKNYKKSFFNHNFLTLLRVSSIEIVVKKECLDTKNLRWDPEYGLGSKYPGGLEVVFLQDSHRKGVVSHFVPEYFVEHPYESSGRDFSFKKLLLRVNIFKRAMPKFWLPMIFLFYIKNRSSYSRSGVGFLDFLKALNGAS